MGEKGRTVELKCIGIEKYIQIEGISLREFAKKCNMPVSTISRFVNGKTDIKKSNIDKILKVTGMTYKECFKEELEAAE